MNSKILTNFKEWPENLTPDISADIPSLLDLCKRQREQIKVLREALQKVLRAARCQDVDTDDYVSAMSTGRPLAVALNEAWKIEKEMQ